MPTSYAETLPSSQRWFRYFSFSKCCFLTVSLRQKHFCNPQRGSRTAQSWGVWELLLSVPEIKAIQVVNTILWATTCWVSQSLSKLLLHNKLCKSTASRSVGEQGLFIYCCLPPKPSWQGGEKSLRLLGSEGKLPCELKIEDVPCYRCLQTQLSEQSWGFFQPCICFVEVLLMLWKISPLFSSNPSPFSVLKGAAEHLCP